ncbi:MAG TPA: hypothetical protein VIR63_01865, partial [Pontiella sp.]
MMYPRVNLLVKSEQRYQGVVSHRFIILCGIATTVSVVVLFGAISLVRYESAKAELITARSTWELMEPRYNVLMREERGLKVNRQVLNLFDGWTESKASFVELLECLQDTVPENVQATRFYVRGDGGSYEYATPEDMSIVYDLLIEGLCIGESAESDVIKLRKELLERERFKKTFELLKLASLRKTGENKREF